jgi:hypothetical protein
MFLIQILTAQGGIELSLKGSEQCAFRIPRRLAAELRKKAKEQHTTLTAQIIRAIELYVSYDWSMVRTGSINSRAAYLGVARLLALATKMPEETVRRSLIAAASRKYPVEDWEVIFERDELSK